MAFLRNERFNTKRNINNLTTQSIESPWLQFGRCSWTPNRSAPYRASQRASKCPRARAWPRQVKQALFSCRTALYTPCKNCRSEDLWCSVPWQQPALARHGHRSLRAPSRAALQEGLPPHRAPSSSCTEPRAAGRAARCGALHSQLQRASGMRACFPFGTLELDTVPNLPSPNNLPTCEASGWASEAAIKGSASYLHRDLLA